MIKYNRKSSKARIDVTNELLLHIIPHCLSLSPLSLPHVSSPPPILVIVNPPSPNTLFDFHPLAHFSFLSFSFRFLPRLASSRLSIHHLDHATTMSRKHPSKIHEILGLPPCLRGTRTSTKMAEKGIRMNIRRKFLTNENYEDIIRQYNKTFHEEREIVIGNEGFVFQIS